MTYFFLKSWTYYKDSSKILGQTYGMLVLQDFMSLTPNLLARTIETVEGGGSVVFLLGFDFRFDFFHSHNFTMS